MAVRHFPSFTEARKNLPRVLDAARGAAAPPLREAVPDGQVGHQGVPGGAVPVPFPTGTGWRRPGGNRQDAG